MKPSDRYKKRSWKVLNEKDKLKKRAMKNKKGLSAVTSLILIIMIAVVSIGIIVKITYDAIQPRVFEITNNQGNSSEFLIKIVNCDVEELTGDFYVDDDYVKMQRYYSEKINETHGQMCWYDVMDKSNLTWEWLDENCDKKVIPSYSLFEKAIWSCDKGFIVR